MGQLVFLLASEIFDRRCGIDPQRHLGKTARHDKPARGKPACHQHAAARNENEPEKRSARCLFILLQGCCCLSLFKHTQLGSKEDRSEEHTSELQSRENLVCRLLLEKKKKHRKYLGTP